MRFKPTASSPRAAKHAAGFTLAEALAALAFMAIVIPVAVEGLQIANRAGQVAERKAAASRIADRILNEIIVTRQWQSASSGVAEEGEQQYRWRMQQEVWGQQAIRQFSVRVAYLVQGVEYEVRLSTLVDTTTTTQ